MLGGERDLKDVFFEFIRLCTFFRFFSTISHEILNVIRLEKEIENFGAFFGSSEF